MAHNTSYPAYTPGVALPSLSYEGIYWPSPKEEEEEKEKEIMANSHLHGSKELPPQEGSNDLLEQDLQNQPELSPTPSSSGTLSHYTPDSATSPNRESPSATQEENGGNEGNGERRTKTRIAFSTMQLQILGKLFSKQMYLSPPQIKDTGLQLGLTYKQVKTWFQNQRMKLKRTQKEKIWMKNGICPPQSFYMDKNPSYYPGYAYGNKNFPMRAGAPEGYAGSPRYGQVLSYDSDPNQIYDNAQNFNSYATAEEWDGNLFGKATGACFTSQAFRYISQQKMNFYHTMKMEDGYPFSNVSATATATAFPSQPSTSTAFPSQLAAFPSQPSTSTAFPSQLAAFPSQPSTSTAFPSQLAAFSSQPSTYTAFPSQPAGFSSQPSTSTAFPSLPAAFPSQPAGFPSQPSTSTAFPSQPAGFPSQPSTSTAFPSQPAAFPSQPSTSTAFPSQPAAFPSQPSTSTAFPSQPAIFPSSPATATAFSSQPAAFPSQPAFQHYQTPLQHYQAASQIPGAQRNFNNA